jgi:hypothetical protein
MAELKTTTKIIIIQLFIYMLAEEPKDQLQNKHKQRGKHTKAYT